MSCNAKKTAGDIEIQHIFPTFAKTRQYEEKHKQKHQTNKI